ncbi:MAG: hypothetical protein GWP70_05950 [Proteobacteria bacterium]|nr:hypothetical protein [Pseudomonadota bacterium]
MIYLPAPHISDEALSLLIAQVFADCFMAPFHTLLLGGAAQPLYLPARAGEPAQLMFREDYPASALHEVAHWCIAGAIRRQHEDFGYPYICPPRSLQRQREFFSAELRTQSLERFFADALGLTFKPSADNFEADVDAFAKAIDAYSPQRDAWLCSVAGTRARVFAQALAALRSALSASASLDEAYKSMPWPTAGVGAS